MQCDTVVSAHQAKVTTERGQVGGGGKRRMAWKEVAGKDGNLADSVCVNTKQRNENLQLASNKMWMATSTSHKTDVVTLRCTLERSVTFPNASVNLQFAECCTQQMHKCGWDCVG
ncbi:hypothetical protein E2C01_046204 [Portunus trituberculatus]|uniref:Uncharacterized protein n=1 Tax=Portunus trituberculatus TaxID=210409 RepID=A0A5B7G462_PORTR|nr:hypothetical protein [Portunus trituberculatus]